MYTCIAGILSPYADIGSEHLKFQRVSKSYKSSYVESVLTSDGRFFSKNPDISFLGY